MPPLLVQRLGRCDADNRGRCGRFAVGEANLPRCGESPLGESLSGWCALRSHHLDFFDFHSHLYQESDVSVQFANIMTRFLQLLENGEYRKNREVAWYADKLCITPKYLSQVTKEVSGYAANFWINRYTSLDISRLLRDKSLTFVSISDLFGFSSPAYFCRYVQRYLGTNPTEYRG